MSKQDTHKKNHAQDRVHAKNQDQKGSAQEPGVADTARVALEQECAELKQRVQDLEGQVQEYLSLSKRKQAEFENYRKRTLAERAEFEKTAQRRLLSELLEIDDNFLHALNNAETANDFEEYKKGVELIARQLSILLAKYGVTKFESLGKEFDPEYHEAMMMVQEGEHTGDVVTQVFREGYLLHDKVLRLARVKVSKGQGAGAPAAEQGDAGEAGTSPEDQSRTRGGVDEMGAEQPTAAGSE